MKDDLRGQKVKMVWWCEVCKLPIQITSIKTHQLNGHAVSQYNYNPDYSDKDERKTSS